jgi:hypothetical protein
MVELHQPVLARSTAKVADEPNDEKPTGHHAADRDELTLGGDDGEVRGHGERVYDMGVTVFNGHGIRP